MPPPADRALRRMVSQLALTDNDDIKGVLRELSSAQRQRVEDLLAEYAGLGQRLPDPGPTPRKPPVRPLRGLSPWLAARLDGVADPADEDRFSHVMTPVARDALEAAAALIRERGVDRAEVQNRPPPPSFIGQVAEWARSRLVIS